MIYLDYAATTPVDKRVLQKILPFYADQFGNPSSIYQFAQKSRIAIDTARHEIAQILGCLDEEVYFTSSGTEANNWALFGIAAGAKQKKIHLITTTIEHESVLQSAKELERRGAAVSYLPVDHYGHINPKDLEKALTPETVLVSIMCANNEIGTIEDIKKISATLKKRKILFHTDACQAAGALPLNVQNLGVDMMTINGGKIYGPKGVGALYIKKGTPIVPLLYGGGQEHRLRAGTENVAGIIGLAEALKIAEAIRIKEVKRLTALRDHFIQDLQKKIPGLILNGDPTNRLPNNINISLPGIDGESLLMRLDMAGICVSSGSACTSASLEPSHVLLGIGLSKTLAKNSLRITLGRTTSKKDLDFTAKALANILKNFS